MGNFWSDAALGAASGDPEGRLDLYNVHYYDWMHDDSWGYDPCRKPVSYWGLDKPTVVRVVRQRQFFRANEDTSALAFAP